MSVSDSRTSESKTLDRPTEAKIPEQEKPREDPGLTEKVADNGGEGEEGEDQDGDDEEEGECGFCLFMKGGGCKDSFVAWENCIEEAEKNKEDIVEKCFEVTGALKKCMEAHADYYEPILRAEKVAEEEVVKELEKEAAAKGSEQEKISAVK
ncbi:hypothetical protein UlMin_041136 [Ulmus minor]